MPDGRPAPTKPVLINPLVAVTAVNRARVSLESCLDSERFLEGQFYLSTYGSADMLSTFLMRHGFFEKACQFIIDKKAPPKVPTCFSRTTLPFQVFVESVFMPMVHRGGLEDLQKVMRDMDPTLAKWSPYMVAACRRLNSNKYFHVLYDMQVCCFF